VFKDYVANASAAALTPLALSDRQSTDIAFYWADTGENREVKVTFKANGIQCEKVATLNVKKPSCSFTALLGEVKFLGSPPTRVGLFPRPGQVHGIKFDATVSIPGGFGFAQGKWAYWQTVMPDRVFKFTSGTCGKVSLNGILVLDTTLPYDGAEHNTGTSFSTGDSPSTALAGFTQVVVKEDDVAGKGFAMYVMFKPAGVASKWVPLQKIDWGDSICAEIVGGTWALLKNEYNNFAAETSVHPVWPNNVANATIVPGPCPPSCGL
jgi:hypothetical protein